jgi:hypothetical protein
VEIWFDDDETAALCCRSARLTARWGVAGGRVLGRRLAQIEAAPTVDALSALPGKCRLDVSDGTWLIDAGDVAIIRLRVGRERAGAVTKAYVISVNDHPNGRARR